MKGSAGLKEKLPPALPPIIEGDPEGLHAKVEAVGPFHPSHPAPPQALLEAELPKLFGIGEAVEVEVKKIETPPMMVHQGEGGARHRFAGGDPEPPGEPLGHAGLAGSQIAAEQQHRSGGREFADPAAELTGALRRVGCQGPVPHG